MYMQIILLKHAAGTSFFKHNSSTTNYPELTKRLKLRYDDVRVLNLHKTEYLYFRTQVQNNILVPLLKKNVLL